jgi:hypothetical protein
MDEREAKRTDRRGRERPTSEHESPDPSALDMAYLLYREI